MARTNSAGHDRLREEEPPNSSPQTEAQVNAEFAKVRWLYTGIITVINADCRRSHRLFKN